MIAAQVSNDKKRVMSIETVATNDSSDNKMKKKQNSVDEKMKGTIMSFFKKKL